MALKFPDILEHNNSNFPLVDITSLRGVAYPLNELNDTGSIPANKRNPGTIVFVSGSEQAFYGFKGAHASDWDDPSNWSIINTGGTGSFVTNSQTSSFLDTFKLT